MVRPLKLRISVVAPEFDLPIAARSEMQFSGETADVTRVRENSADQSLTRRKSLTILATTGLFEDNDPSETTPDLENRQCSGKTHS